MAKDINNVYKENRSLLDYFNGCEASKVLILNYYTPGIRNSLMRCVKNLMCVNVDIIKLGGKITRKVSQKEPSVQV